MQEIDLLQIKIDKARENLPKETRDAIDAVDWKAAILALREKKGYSFEQLGDLETETELLMCGLLPPADYPKELEKRMHISRQEANELVNIMNDTVFRKIKDELIKNSERNKIFQKPSKEENIEVPINKPETVQVKSTQVETKAPIKPITPPFSQSEIEAPKSSVDSVMKSAGIELEKKESNNSDNKVTESREDILKKVEQPAPISKITPIQILGEKFTGNVEMKVVKTEHEGSADEKSPASKPKIDPYREIPE